MVADANYEMAFRIRLDMKSVKLTYEDKVLYPGTEFQGASFMLAPPLRLEVVHRSNPDDPATESTLQWYYVKLNPEDYKDYRDYVIKFDQPVPGVVGYKVYWFGRAFCSAWLDGVKLRETPLPSEAEQLKGVTIPPITVAQSRPGTLVWNGVFDWTYRIPEVIGGRCDRGKPLPERFSSFDAVIAIALNGLAPRERLALSEFVKAGGGLVTMGGPQAYGKSHIHTSPLLQGLLPVVTKGLWDLKKAPGGGFKLVPRSDLLKNLAWQDSPRIFYYHDVDVKDGAEGIWAEGVAEVGGKLERRPLVVAWPFGKGKRGVLPRDAAGRPVRWPSPCLGMEGLGAVHDHPDQQLPWTERRPGNGEAFVQVARAADYPATSNPCSKPMDET